MLKRDESGAGTFATVNGVIVVLFLLLFAVQILVGLYASSVVTASSWDAVRRVTASGQDPSLSEPAAEAKARHQLGAFSGHVSFTWDNSDANSIALTVVAHKPNFLPLFLRKPMHLDTVVRTVRARREQLQ